MTPATSGRSSATPFAWFDRGSSCWRTSQGTFLWDSTPFSVTLPKSGSMRSGELFERRMLAPAMPAAGFGSLLPTPAASQAGGDPERHIERKNLHDGASRSKVTELALFVKALLPTPTVGDSKSAVNRTASRQEDSEHHAGLTLTDAIRLLPTPTTSDSNGGGQHGDGGPDLRTVVTALADPNGMAGASPRARAGQLGPVDGPGPLERAERLPGVAWGEYEPAIRRHEHVLGRPHPHPTNQRGALSPMFVEWMMMLPDGWVTRSEMSKTAALRILGNGVVPAQAVAAIGQLLERLRESERVDPFDCDCQSCMSQRAVDVNTGGLL